ncbi:MAG: MarR family transcriptional regulator [Staphylococcus sp.]|uniref:MarR family winged helix-turn-helix transcriptional regulator n=1 Tax=Staphylococcus warneri TaxID=1292 RepID=UPI0030C46A75|nr:MarR family transcriptional regulator [Staphylococcus sp.]
MNKEEVIMTGLRNMFNKIAWLNKSEMQEALKDYKSSEVHCIEAINELDNPNVRSLTEQLFMTRGAISKLTKRLQSKKLVESYQNEHNKKEIYFRLTPKGQQVYHTHQQLHAKFDARDQDVFESLTQQEFESIQHFIEKYNQHLDKEIKNKRLQH